MKRSSGKVGVRDILGRGKSLCKGSVVERKMFKKRKGQWAGGLGRRLRVRLGGWMGAGWRVAGKAEFVEVILRSSFLLTPTRSPFYQILSNLSPTPKSSLFTHGKLKEPIATSESIFAL